VVTADLDLVTDAVLTASRALVGVAARSLAVVDPEVTLPQYRALVVLASRGPRLVGELAEALVIHPSTATRLCDRLVAKKLVTIFGQDVEPDGYGARWPFSSRTKYHLPLTCTQSLWHNSPRCVLLEQTTIHFPIVGTVSPQRQPPPPKIMTTFVLTFEMYGVYYKCGE
jgi:DNA-binding Lrp family transcriptional regulator